MIIHKFEKIDDTKFFKDLAKEAYGVSPHAYKNIIKYEKIRDPLKYSISPSRHELRKLLDFYLRERALVVFRTATKDFCTSYERLGGKKNARILC